MNEQLVRQIARDEIKKNDKSGSPVIPPHKHNGNDNLRIRQSDIINNSKVLMSLDFLPSTDGDTFTFEFVQNPSQMFFYGYAVNNVSAPATQRVIVNGNVQFGNCTTVTGLNRNQGSLSATTSSKSSFIQASNSFFANTTGPSFRVATSQTSFVYVTNGSSVFVTAEVLSWTQTSITIKVDLDPQGASGGAWRLTGQFIII